MAAASGSALTAYVNDGKRNFTQRQWTGYNLSSSSFSTANRMNEAGTAQTFATSPLIRWVAPFGGTVTVNAGASTSGGATYSTPPAVCALAAGARSAATTAIAASTSERRT